MPHGPSRVYRQSLVDGKDYRPRLAKISEFVRVGVCCGERMRQSVSLHFVHNFPFVNLYFPRTRALNSLPTLFAFRIDSYTAPLTP